MNEWVLAFTLGNAAILTNACMLPLYPGLIAFLAGYASEDQTDTRNMSARFLGLLVLLGILTMMTLIGLILSILSTSFGDVLPIILPLIYVLVIIFGILMFMGRNPFVTMQVSSAPALKNPFLRAYVYGLFFGPMTLPCTGPIILSAFTVGTGAGDIVSGLLYFFFFGLGFGWPLVLLPFLALPLQRRIVHILAGNHEIITRASGILLIAVGVFGIITEILPQAIPSFYLDQAGQIVYWVLAFAMMIGVGYFFYHQQAQQEQ